MDGESEKKTPGQKSSKLASNDDDARKVVTFKPSPDLRDKVNADK